MDNQEIPNEPGDVVNDTRSQLNTVTPLSKYLAMTLFVILPFLGGWIGYTYAPEKVVEVEKIVIPARESERKISDAPPTDEFHQRRFTDEQLARQYVIGSTHYGWTIVGTSSHSLYLKNVYFEPEEETSTLFGTLSISYDWQIHDTYGLSFEPESREYALPDVPTNSFESPIMLNSKPISIRFSSGNTEEELMRLCGSDCILAEDANSEDKTTFGTKELNVSIQPDQLTRFYLNMGVGVSEYLSIKSIEVID
jgi:hypothetical protein